MGVVETLEASKNELAVDEQSTIFFESLVAVLQHDLHSDSHRLRGTWRTAYNRILACIEDAGWRITASPFTVTG
jgi:hypothetical protein